MIVENLPDCLELDESYWFAPNTETHRNVYVMTAASRNPRMIMGFDVVQDKTARRIQRMVDSAPEVRRCYTEWICWVLGCDLSWSTYFQYPQQKDTFTVEGVNADLRHYIPILARRSRCFPRKLKTLYAVVEVFVAAW